MAWCRKAWYGEARLGMAQHGRRSATAALFLRLCRVKYLYAAWRGQAMLGSARWDGAISCYAMLGMAESGAVLLC